MSSQVVTRACRQNVGTMSDQSEPIRRYALCQGVCMHRILKTAVCNNNNNNLNIIITPLPY
jgi:hypothetical protein